MERLFIVAGGLAGAAGVALSAAGAHAGGANVTTAATFMLLHAPLFLLVGTTADHRWRRIGAAIVLAGLVLFAGDLLMRHYTGSRLFPMAAPAGGTGMIAGWLVIAASALSRPAR